MPIIMLKLLTKKRLGIVLASFFIVLPQIGTSEKMPANECSIINLIATPDLYDGKLVRVMGYYKKGFEHSVIYVSHIDAEYGIARNGIWIEYGDDEIKMNSVANKYILIEAIFDKNMHGHLGSFSGALRNIRRAVQWPPEIKQP